MARGSGKRREEFEQAQREAVERDMFIPLADILPQLRLLLQVDLEDNTRSLKVLDAQNNVLGDLLKSTMSVKYELDGDPLATITIVIPAERATIESLSVPGMNAPREKR